MALPEACLVVVDFVVRFQPGLESPLGQAFGELPDAGEERDGAIAARGAGGLPLLEDGDDDGSSPCRGCGAGPPRCVEEV